MLIVRPKEAYQNIRINWTTTLSCSLVMEILEDSHIRDGLYPKPGSNNSTVKGGGLPKTDHHFALYTCLFGEIPVHKALIEKATTGKNSKLCTKLANKIKNRLKRYVNIPLKNLLQG